MTAERVQVWTERLRRAANAVRTPHGRSGLRRGVAPTVVPQRTLRSLDPLVVIDVGANRGQFALDVLTACPNASVISFEPLPSEADVFEAILGGVPRVHLLRSAVSDRDGAAQMHVTAAADSSSLHRPTDLQSSTFPGTHQIDEQEVHVCSLDSVSWPLEIPERTLLKIDVQGHEFAVLRGAERLLGQIRWVYVEVPLVELYEGQALAGEVFEQLHRHGYRPVDLSAPTRANGRALQVDVWLDRLDDSVAV